LGGAKCLILGEKHYFLWDTASQSTKWLDILKCLGTWPPAPPWLRLCTRVSYNPHNNVSHLAAGLFYSIRVKVWVFYELKLASSKCKSCWPVPTCSVDHKIIIFAGKVFILSIFTSLSSAVWFTIAADNKKASNLQVHSNDVFRHHWKRVVAKQFFQIDEGERCIWLQPRTNDSYGVGTN